MSTVVSAGSLRSKRRAITASRIGGTVLIMLVWVGALISIFPLAWTFVSSFRPNGSFLVSPFVFNPHEFIIKNYQSALADGSIWIGFKNTCIQVTVVLITTLFFCPLAGYGFAKFQFRGRGFLFGLMMLTLFFVPITQYIPLLIEMNQIGWINTYQAMVMPLVISSLGIFWMTGVISGVSNELLHAARVDGCGSFSVWWRIVMPVIRPALVSLAVVTFLTAYNDYFWPLLILPEAAMQTVQIALQLIVTALNNTSSGTADVWGPILAGSAIVFLPTVIIFLSMQRYFIRGMLEGSVKE